MAAGSRIARTPMMQPKRYLRQLAIATVMACACFVSSAPAATTPDDAMPDDTTHVTLDPVEVGAWADGFFPYALAAGQIAGAVVTVVQGDRVVLARGYGHADVDAGTPMKADETVVRPGSISKLFTWTAVMQLVEQGHLDLDRDIQDYLDFPLPARDDGPITMRHLLTHTPGFEEVGKDLIVTGVDGPTPLREALVRLMPRRIFPAGKVPAYSNYGTALAGYIVERIAGQPFEQYVREQILEPLEMASSTFQQPLPASLEARMSKGYRLGTQAPRPFEFVSLAPAGALSTTASDMGRFMQAFLGGGAAGPQAVLQADTIEAMFTTAYPVLPRVKSMRLGFFDCSTRGQRAVCHGGDTENFHSDLVLFPDQQIGVFMSLNSLGKEASAARVRRGFRQLFTERFLPGAVADEPVTVDEEAARAHARLVQGRYQWTRRGDGTLLSLAQTVSPVSIVATADGELIVPQLVELDGRPLRWREVAPFVWRAVGREELLVAEVQDGRVVRGGLDPAAAAALFEPFPPSRSPAWLLPAFAAGLVVLLATFAAWPIGGYARWRLRRQPSLERTERLSLRAVRIGAGLVVLVTALWGVVLSLYRTFLTSRADGWMLGLQALSVLVFVGGWIAAIVHFVVVWRARRGWLARGRAAVVVLAMTSVLWLACTHHLLALSTRY
jgi:CubicO group peptidase (beta-lactamase class C family)